MVRHSSPGYRNCLIGNGHFGVGISEKHLNQYFPFFKIGYLKSK